MITLSSPEAFVKALGSSNDVELAISAWKNEDLYIPSKGQFIATWALKQLLKNRNALLDERIWVLLESILLSTEVPPSWLSTLLFKTPVVPILTTVLHECTKEEDPVNSEQLLASCRRVLDTVVPLAYPRTRFDTILDCFWAALEVASEQKDTEPILALIALSIEGFKAAFNKATNKSKIYTVFLEAHLLVWLKAYNVTKSSRLKELLWTSAIEILCSLDGLRLTLQSHVEGHTNLFKELANASHTYPHSYDIIPRLFQVHQEAVAIHRSSLTQLGIETSSSRLFTSFASICSIDSEEALHAQLSLVRSVEREVGNINYEKKWESALKAITQLCIDRMNDSRGTYSPSVESIIETLIALGNMEYALLMPHTESILASIALFEARNEPPYLLWNVILTYHSKTRTLDQLCNHLFSVIPVVTNPGKLQSSYTLKDLADTVFGGSLFGMRTGSSLSVAINRFLTPSQLVSVATGAISAVAASVIDAQATLTSVNQHERGPKLNDQLDLASVIAAMKIRLATFVIPGLSTSTLPSNLRSELFELGDELQKGVIEPMLGVCLEKSNSTFWSLQFLGTSILQLISSTNQDYEWFRLQEPLVRTTIHDSGSIFTSSAHSPALKLGLARVLLRYSSDDVPTMVFHHILPQLHQGGSWNGDVINVDNTSLPTAYWYLLSERWLSNFASQATEEQMENLAASFVAACTLPSPLVDTRGITPTNIITRMFRNAWFWEQERINGAILSAIMKHTSKIEELGPQLLDNEMASMSIHPPEIGELARCFYILLFYSSEALKMHVGSSIARRAILLDFALSQPSNQDSNQGQIRVYLRLNASRRLQDDSPAFHQFLANPAVIKFLISSVDDLAGDRAMLKVYGEATKRILETALPLFLRNEQNSNRLLNNLHDLISFPDEPEVFLLETTPWKHEAWACILYSISQWFKATSLSTAMVESIGSLVSKLQLTLQESMLQLRTKAYPDLQLLLRLLRACLAAGRTLSSNETGAMELDINAILPVLQSFYGSKKDLQRCYGEFLWILVDELQTKQSQLDIITKLISIYHLTPSDLDLYASLDSPIRQAVKLLNAESFRASLELMSETLAWCPNAKLVHISTVFLKDSPEGTFRIAQSALADNLSCFKDVQFSWDTSSNDLPREILMQLLYICQEKPAFLRSYEAGSIFTLLARVSQSSTISEEITYTDIFHTITRVTSALVRNRRDLVVQLLPHLSVILCNLFGHFRSPKPNLGQKQRRAISNCLPAWISLQHPLGAQEASALARLLVALTSKTVVKSKSHPSSTTNDASHEAQSIAKPFGKHAYCIIGAYIEVANDPLCLLGRDIRAELAPGLYALCGMSGEKGRDALMPTLDGGGKMILKMLWSSYEMQRYSGQG